MSNILFESIWVTILEKEYLNCKTFMCSIVIEILVLFFSRLVVIEYCPFLWILETLE